MEVLKGVYNTGMATIFSFLKHLEIIVLEVFLNLQECDAKYGT